MLDTNRRSPDVFVTWVALVGGMMGTSIEALLLITTGNSDLHLTNLVWGLLFTAIPAALIILGKPNAPICIAAAFVAILAASVFTQTFDPGRARIWLVALLFTSGTVLPLVRTHKRVLAGVFAAVTPLLIWITREPDEAIVDTIGVSVVFSMIYLAAVYQILSNVRDMRRNEARKVAAFTFSPIATWEQDYTAVLDRFKKLRGEGVTDLRAYLDEDPNRVPELLALCRQGSFSKATFEVFEVEGRYQFLAPGALEQVGDGIAGAIGDQMVALWNGEHGIVSEVAATTFKGKRIDLQIHWAPPIVDGEPDYSSVLLAAVDLTAQKDAERRLADEVEAKDQFVASVSHELRTPLTAVVGIAEELADNRGTIEPDEAEELIGVLASESRDVANIVEDLLVAARLDSGQVTIALERTDLATTVDTAATHFGCEVDIEPGIVVKADPQRVRQIVRNLLSNAERYGGEDVSVVGRSNGDTATLEVRDNGEGIPEHLSESVFDPYRRAEPAPGLTASVGLGLTIARSLARLMEGDLTYDYTDSKSVFRLELPLC